MKSSNYPVSRQENIIIQELKDEILIYDLRLNKAFCLNQTSALIWQFCDGKNSVSEISDLMSQKLNILVSEDLVWLAVDGLRRENLLEQSTESEPHFVGVSRREAVKRVGLASMVMLPIISSVVAPQAIMAQSGSGGMNFNFPCVITFPNGVPTTNCPAGECFPTVFNGLQCCASSVEENGHPPGILVGCGFTQSQCDSLASENCCSGAGTLGTVADPVCNRFFGGGFTCHCSG